MCYIILVPYCIALHHILLHHTIKYIDYIDHNISCHIILCYYNAIMLYYIISYYSISLHYLYIYILYYTISLCNYVYSWTNWTNDKLWCPLKFLSKPRVVFVRLVEQTHRGVLGPHAAPSCQSRRGKPLALGGLQVAPVPPSWTSTCRVNKNGQLTHHPNAWIAPTHLLVTWLYSWHLPMRSQQLGSSFAGGSLQSTAKVCEFKWQNLSEHKHHDKYRQFSTST